MEKTLVIIPTYDEKDNVGPISQAVFAALPDAHILFVDDNSPDGTGNLIDTLVAADPRIHVLHRPGKQGLGRAYIAGFKWALAGGYERIIEMDAGQVSFDGTPSQYAEHRATVSRAADAGHGDHHPYDHGYDQHDDDSGLLSGAGPMDGPVEEVTP